MLGVSVAGVPVTVAAHAGLLCHHVPAALLSRLGLYRQGWNRLGRQNKWLGQVTLCHIGVEAAWWNVLISLVLHIVPCTCVLVNCVPAALWLTQQTASGNCTHNGNQVQAP